jgi:hypothetical protein
MDRRFCLHAFTTITFCTLLPGRAFAVARQQPFSVQEISSQPVNLGHCVWHVALRINVMVKHPARGLAMDHFYTGYFNHAVT